MQTNDQLFKEHLAAAGLRSTNTRLAILSTLKNTDHPLSIQQIIASVGANNHFTSVYRSIAAMSNHGLLHEVLRGFKNLYELGEVFQPHHHHATCKVCGKSWPVHDQKLEKLIDQSMRNIGMKPDSHHLEMFGVCASCQKNEQII